MAKIKCYLCGKVFDEKKLIYTKDPDELMCPMCGAREPGFEEVKDNECTYNAGIKTISSNAVACKGCYDAGGRGC